jgi:hypothetical protein
VDTRDGRPCHYRATSISPEQSPPDTHGQRLSARDLDCSLGQLVTGWLGLPWEQGVAGSNPAVRPQADRPWLHSLSHPGPAGPALEADRVGGDALSHAHSERREQLDRFAGA